MKTRFIAIVMAMCLPLGAAAQHFSAKEKPEDIRKVCDAVAAWQIANQSKVVHAPYAWTNGTLYKGMTTWYKTTGNTACLDFVTGIGDSLKWGLGPRLYHADDICVGQSYIDIYTLTGNKKAIQPLMEHAFWVASHPSNATLKKDDPIGKDDRWSWCDALFMAPPVFAEYARLFHDPELLGYMDREFWATTDYLYSREDSLYFRDSGYFDKREANGEKIFWGRGNAWVISGLARLLPLLPEAMKQPYEQLFREMAERLIKLQQPDGSWHASLLDPASYPVPETSSTGLIAYALWWGINQGYLPADRYLSHAEAAWQVLLHAQHPDGMLGYVQPIGADPREVTADMTEVYGAAAMALTAIQIMEYNRLQAGIGRLSEADSLLAVLPLSGWLFCY